MTARVLVAALAAMIALPAKAQPSFDCRARSLTDVEGSICVSPRLSALDREMAAAYLAVGGAPGVAEAQRGWLGRRDRTCTKPPGETVESCLLRLYAERLQELRGAK